MDILDQLDGVLEEVSEGATGGDQVGRTLLNRYFATRDPQERQTLVFLSSILLVATISDDKGLLTKCKRIIKDGYPPPPR